MTERDVLLRTYLDAARALACDALSALDTRKALLVGAALEQGAEVILVHATTTGSVIMALHPPGPDANPVELCRLELSASEVSH